MNQIAVLDARRDASGGYKVDVSRTIWTGIGAVGAFAVGIAVLGEQVSMMRIAAARFIVAGLVMMKLAAATECKGTSNRQARGPVQPHWCGPPRRPFRLPDFTSYWRGPRIDLRRARGA